MHELPSARWWPTSEQALVDLQHWLAREADAAVVADPWSLESPRLIGGCVVAFAGGEAGPGKPGDRAWAAAGAWHRGTSTAAAGRRADRHLEGSRSQGEPRRADDVVAQSVVAGRTQGAYAPGLLARREGPVLAAAVAALDVNPEVLLVDATGADHPRRAGLAIHLGAACGLPTVGVTQRPLVASGDPPPELQRGAMAPVRLESRCVGFWVLTRTGSRPIIAHAGWRTTPETAASTVLAASTEAARTPVPLQEARRVAREARSLADAG